MKSGQKIIPCLWFNDNADEAVKFYTNIFPNSKRITTVKYTVDTPSHLPIGSTMTVSFEIENFKFLALNGGSFFKPNPSISFHFKCKTKDEVDYLFEKLSKDGKVLMPLDKYPFSERYAWVEDKYGFSWQLIFIGDIKMDQRITPVLMYVGNNAGLAQEAIELYISAFKNSKINMTTRYGKDELPDKEGTIKYSGFVLDGQEFGAMDSAHNHAFNFTEGISLMIECSDQKEIDHFYNMLSSDPNSEICGWLKDKFKVSWQLVAPDFEKYEAKKECMSAIMEMKRLDLEKLKKIYKESK